MGMVRIARNPASAPPSPKLDDRRFLDSLSRQAFRYFIEQTVPSSGLTKDRSSKNSPLSIAASGFGLSALALAAERGWIPRQEAYDRALQAIASLEALQRRAPEQHGAKLGAFDGTFAPVGIDQGAMLLMIANHQDGAVW